MKNPSVRPSVGRPAGRGNNKLFRIEWQTSIRRFTIPSLTHPSDLSFFLTPINAQAKEGETNRDQFSSI